MTENAPDLLLGLVGRFNHVLLVELPDGRWQGSSRKADSVGFSVCVAEDPVEALKGCTQPSETDWMHLI